jgi:hypothetical protein
MYAHVSIAKDSMYFINSINEPIYLIDFIEKSDLQNESFSVISKWESLGNKFFKKNVYIGDKVISNEKVYQKVLYIKNSFLSNINFCKDLYSEATGLDCGPVIDLSIYKKNPGDNSISFKKDKVENLINVYVVLNPDPDSIPFCIDKHNDIYIRPESASILMIPDDLEHQVWQNVTSNTYYAKASFLALPKKHVDSV